MKIVDIKVHLPIGLLRIITDTTLEGCCVGLIEREAIRAKRYCRDILVGKDPLDREKIWQEMVALENEHSLSHIAGSAIDVALWDLGGKVLNLPVYRLIGGFRNRIPAYRRGVISTDNKPDVNAIADEAVKAKEEGFHGYKDGSFHDADSLAKAAKNIREAVGPAFLLLYNAGGRYDFSDALRAGRILEEEDYYWLEEPLNSTNSVQMKKLVDSLDIPVASGPCPPRRFDKVSQAITNQTIDFISVSVPESGGITDVIKIARTAEAFGIHCEIAGEGILWGFVHAQLLGSIKNSRFFEAFCSGMPAGSSLIKNPLLLRDGFLSLPEGPGLGVELDWQEVEKQTYEII